jgi:GGDEF domain-containing protein
VQSHGRASDAIGGLTLEEFAVLAGEFAVLAPATPPEGAVKMAQRLSQIVEAAGPRPTGMPPLRVRVGYEAVRDLHATPVEPVSLLEHARAALHQVVVTGTGERIRAYRA